MPAAQKTEDVTRRIVSAIKEGRIGSGLRWRARTALRKAAAQVARRPVLRRFAIGTLSLVPPLRRRLNDALAPSRSGRPHGADDLSPDAQLILRRLVRTRKGG